MQIPDDRIEVEALEFLTVIESLLHRTAPGRVLVQDLQIQLIRPPVRIGRGGGDRMPAHAARYRTLGLGGGGTLCIKHVASSFEFAKLRPIRPRAQRPSRRGAHLAQSPRKMTSHSRSTRLPSEPEAGLGTSYHSMSSTLPHRSQMK